MAGAEGRSDCVRAQSVCPLDSGAIRFPISLGSTNRASTPA